MEIRGTVFDPKLEELGDVEDFDCFFGHDTWLPGACAPSKGIAKWSQQQAPPPPPHPPTVGRNPRPALAASRFSAEGTLGAP